MDHEHRQRFCEHRLKEGLTVQAKLRLNTIDGNGRQFLAESGSQHQFIMDDAQGNAGPRPIEFALLALGGCTAFDVITILRKMRQDVTAYDVELTAEQSSQPPKVFTKIEITHYLTGHVSPQAVEKAIHLSETKYCSVEAMIGKTAEITHTVQINSDDGPRNQTSGNPPQAIPLSS